MKKSLQDIEDYYIRKGLSREKLRRALENDKKYQKLLAERRNKLAKKFKITSDERRKYVLSTDEDYEILNKIHQLERKELSAEDKRIVKFIRTQLQQDWRSPVIKLLDKISKKYKKSKN